MRDAHSILDAPIARPVFDDGAAGAADPDRENLTWELFGAAERELSAQIVASGWIPDLIIGSGKPGAGVGGVG